MRKQAVYEIRAAKYHKDARVVGIALGAGMIKCDAIADRTKSKRIAKKNRDRVARFTEATAQVNRELVGVDFAEPSVIKAAILKTSRMLRKAGVYMKGLHGLQSNGIAYGYRG